MTGKTRHVSVLEREVIEWIGAEQGGHFLDCTLGGAGHTLAMLNAHSENTIVGIDRDERALERAAVRLAEVQHRVDTCHGGFGDLRASLAHLEGEQLFTGVLADLGVSTDQLFEDRGFSFKDASPLDMRMDETSDKSAHNVVNEYSERDLFVALKTGGVGKDAKAIARSIIKNRPIDDTKTLGAVIAAASSYATRRKQAHPATVAFQAIRIEVNDEISQIESMLRDVPPLMKPGGRLVVISFHSTEDKLVTRMMRKWEGEKAPANWRGASQEVEGIGTLLTRKAVTPSEEEIKANPAARSARMRVFEFSEAVHVVKVL